MTIEIDTSTGLPVLPRGYFWRVGGEDRDGDHLLRIMKGPFFPLCYWVTEAWIYGLLTEEKIQRTAKDRFSQWEMEQKSNSLVGNYPPKNLK